MAAASVSPAPWSWPVSIRGGVELVEVGAVEQQVGAVRRGPQVPALDQRPLRAERVQRAGRLALGRVVDDIDVDQQPHLVEVRRDQRGEREQLVAKRIQRARMQQRVAVHGRAHRVDDQRHRARQALSRQVSATVSMIADEASMPVLAAWMPMSVATASIWPAMTSSGIS